MKLIGLEAHFSLKNTWNTFGKNMFAVDYHFEKSAGAAEFVKNLPFSEEGRKKDCHLNGERILDLL
jgi:predicted TIM-barrel fold metal-dependent hydrolase